LRNVENISQNLSDRLHERVAIYCQEDSIHTP